VPTIFSVTGNDRQQCSNAQQRAVNAGLVHSICGCTCGWQNCDPLLTRHCVMPEHLSDESDS